MRRRYPYHPEWRRKRHEAKFDRVLVFAHGPPMVRDEAAAHLGDATASYIDRRVIGLVEDGATIAGTLRRLPTDPDARTARIEAAVRRLLAT